MNHPDRGEDDLLDELLLDIQACLEELFSDAHLSTDGFLLKHVQKNKDGFVSLKFLTGLKKVKVLTTNWHKTAAGAGCSDLLELNSECTKVRRLQPLPKWLLSSPTCKAVLVRNIPDEQATGDGAGQCLEGPPLSEKILHKFRVYGNVTSVCVLPAGEELPKHLQHYARRFKDLGQHLRAVVKFDSLESVRQALKAEHKTPDGKGMSVLPFCTWSRPDDAEDQNMNQHEYGTDEEPSSRGKICDERDASESLDVSKQATVVPTDYKSQPIDGLNPTMSLHCGDEDEGNSKCPWVLRRKVQALDQLNVPGPVLIVLRQPHGPDGTKGFLGRGRPCQPWIRQD